MTNEELINSSEAIISKLSKELDKFKVISKAHADLLHGSLRIKIVDENGTELNDITELIDGNEIRSLLSNQLTAERGIAEHILRKYFEKEPKLSAEDKKVQSATEEVHNNKTGQTTKSKRTCYSSKELISDEELIDLHCNKHLKITEIAKLKEISKWTLYERMKVMGIKINRSKRYDVSNLEEQRAEGAQSILFTSEIVSGEQSKEEQPVSELAPASVPAPACAESVNKDDTNKVTDKELQKMYFTSCMTPNEISEKTGLHLTEVFTRLEKIQLELKEAEKECATSRQTET